MEKKIRFIESDIEDEKREIRNIERSDTINHNDIAKIEEVIAVLEYDKAQLVAQIPSQWPSQREQYLNLANTETKARRNYRSNVDEAYEPLTELQDIIRAHGLILAHGSESSL